MTGPGENPSLLFLLALRMTGGPPSHSLDNPPARRVAVRATLPCYRGTFRLGVRAAPPRARAS
jgi:hypothetical protein